MVDKLQKVRDTAAADPTKAADMLRWLLQHEPSAEAWVLAAEWVSDATKKIAYLRRALALDPWHTQANRLLAQLEGAKPAQQTAEVVAAKDEWARTTGLKPAVALHPQHRPDRFQRNAARQRVYTRVGCLSGILFSVSLTLFTFRVFGLINTGFFNQFAGYFGQPTPVAVIEGTPFAQVEDAPLRMTPSYRSRATSQDMQIIDNGYMHEHHFQASRGGEYAIYVQFLSVSANRVSRNVAVITPDGEDADYHCQPGRILEGDNNVTFICSINQTGTWRVRVVGRDKESVGAYFIGVENMLR